MAFATSLIGGARRAASARGLTPQELAMYQAMQSDMPRPEPRPAPMQQPAPMPQQPRPLIGGQMAGMSAPPMQQPKKPPSMWDGIAQDPLAFLLRGSDGVVERQKAQAEQEIQQDMLRQGREAGLDDGALLAMQLNPEKFGESYSHNYQPQVSTFYDPTSGKWNEKPGEAPKPQIYNTPKGLVEAAPGQAPKLVYGTEAQEKPPWIGATKGPDGQWGWDQNYIKGYRQMHPGSAGGGGNAPPSGFRWKPDGSLERIPGGPADKPPGPEYDAPTMRKFMSQAQTLDALEGSINQYMDLIKQYGPQVMTTGIGGDNPIAKKLDAANTNIKMQAKALFDLGVINGPDLQILNSAIPPVTGIDAWGKSKESVDGQLQMLRDYIARGRDQIPEQFVSRARPNGAPQAPTKPSREQMANSPYLQGFSPEMRQAMLEQMAGSPEQQAGDPNDEAFIDSLFPEDGADAPPEGSGITPEEWALMPPEDKALFQ